MGLSGQAFDAIGREHAHRPIAGDILFIGRQTTYFTVPDLVNRMRDYGHTIDPTATEMDRSTVNRNGCGGYITDRSIFRALGVPSDRIKALDVSDYEGAEVIHDLNRPLPSRLHATADFVVDGSTLDNLFNPAQGLLNIDALLRAGGRALLINAWNARDSAYTLCSAAWYFDFFVTNGYDDCRVYLCVSERAGANVYWLDPAFMRDALDSPSAPSFGRRPFLVVFAEKSDRAAEAVTPTQSHYRSPAEWQAYRENIDRMAASPRPHLLRSNGNLKPRHIFLGHHLIDSEFKHQGRVNPALVATIRRLTPPRTRKLIKRVLMWQ
jgi:hypothetical protein